MKSAATKSRSEQTDESSVGLETLGVSGDHITPGAHPRRRPWLLGGLFAVLLVCSGPPINVWPTAFVALVPLIMLAGDAFSRRRDWMVPVYLASVAYWLLVLHGVRHAHPAMFLGWIALSAYLAIYHVAFVALTRRMINRGFPLMLAALLAWLIQELIRNYFATGISVSMLGHAVADVPSLIRIADLGGTYLVSAMIVAVNVSVACLLKSHASPMVQGSIVNGRIVNGSIGLLGIGLTLGYAWFQNQETPPGSPLDSQPTATKRFLLIQNDQPVDYAQEQSREVEIFDAYAQTTIRALADYRETIDVIVWPESMFNGGVPWVMADDDAMIPPDAGVTRAELLDSVKEQRRFFEQRADYIQTIAATTNGGKRPEMLVGCGVVGYTPQGPRSYSGLIAIGNDGKVSRWYGKHHLVMFGEYVPLISHIPGIRDLIPPGLGVTPGDDASPMTVGDRCVLPSICIETAVERVPVRAVADALDSGDSVDAIVTVTNDRWFDHACLIEHHLRCAQLAAVGCRRPILSAANGGPTAWIDENGQIVSRLKSSENGSVVGEVSREEGTTVYVTLQDWPHWILAAIGLFAVAPRPRRLSGDSPGP